MKPTCDADIEKNIKNWLKYANYRRDLTLGVNASSATSSILEESSSTDNSRHEDCFE
jgi:hypothetical protein